MCSSPSDAPQGTTVPQTMRRVASAGAELAVYETGVAGAPTVILHHGYPDTHAVWDEVVALLAPRLHVVTFDMRGMGASSAPTEPHAYALPVLADDLRAVAATVSPDRPVHLVGHDGGAFVGWEAVTSGGKVAAPRPGAPADAAAPESGASARAALRPGAPAETSAPESGAWPPVPAFASFTTVAGPRLDYGGRWVMRRLRRPTPAALAQLASQARRSWYVGAVQLPVLPERVLRSMGSAIWPRILPRSEGVRSRDGHPAPTLTDDLLAGLALYRENLRGVGGVKGMREGRGVKGGSGATGRGSAPAEIPVQIVVPTRDRYISSAFYADCDRWARELARREIRAGHWFQRSHPEAVAAAILELVEHVEGASAAAPLRRARRRSGVGRRQVGLAVVTGAGSGIGRATALALARAGADVVAADNNLAAAERTATAAREDAMSVSTGTVTAARVDVADAADMERFATAIRAEHGVPSIVVANAGVGVGGPFLATSLADWERVIAVNLWGVIHTARLFAAQMVAAGQQGQIVSLASAAAYAPSRALPAYATTKAAVLMLSACLRAEPRSYTRWHGSRPARCEGSRAWVPADRSYAAGR